MKIAFCTDDDNGMLFNGRRLSRDRAVTDDLINSLSGSQKLWIHPFSLKLFQGREEMVIIDEELLSHAGKNDLCFIENIDITPYEALIDELIIYRWNRRYPSDMKLTLNPEDFEATAVKEIKGSSHEKITKEVFRRC